MQFVPCFFKLHIAPLTLVVMTLQGVRCEATRGKISLVPPRPVAKFDTLLLMFVGHVDSVCSLIVATDAGCSRRLGFAVCAVPRST